MLKNYVKIILRNLTRNKYYSIVNIVGLSTSLMCCILIMLWVQDELSFDKFNVNSDNLFRIITKTSIQGEKCLSGVTPPALSAKMQNNFPEVKYSSRFYQTNAPVKYGNKVLDEGRLSFADPSFLKMFTLSFIQGNYKTALNEPNSIIISRKIAEKIFGNENPVGKLLQIDDKYNLKITGVIKEMPGNSSLQFNMLAPFDLLKQSGVNMDDWHYFEFTTLILLKPGTSYESISKKLNSIMKNEFPERKDEYSIQPLTDIRLYSSEIKFDPMQHGEIKFVKVFVIAALLMIIIACINFVNLTTASSFTRSKEIGVRTVLGAFRKNLIMQFMYESVFIFLLSLSASFILVNMILPSFNKFVGKELILLSSGNLSLFIVLIGITLVSCIISCHYPVFVLAKNQQSVILHFKESKNNKGNTYRKFLVVGQFILSALFILFMITINRQNGYLQTKNLGFEKENLIYIPFKIRPSALNSYNVTRNELLKIPGVKGVTNANNIFTGLYSGFSNIKWEGQDPEERATIYLCTAGYDFIETTGMKIIDGRSFSQEYPSDVENSVILNSKAVKAMNLKSPVGKTLNFYGQKNIIGVVEDFHFKSLYQEVEPIMLLVNPVCRYVFIRVDSKNISSTINSIKSVWKHELPDLPFNYNFIGDTINSQYKSEQRLEKIINYFALFAILISSLGLFGMVFFMTKKRVKEIAIRKVLGASIINIFLMFAKDFAKWILIANIIAWPLAYYAMGKWLQNFAYHTEITWWMFVLAGGIALLIALVTISFQVVKAAAANPVESIKYE